MFPRTIGYSFKNSNIHLRIRFTPSSEVFVRYYRNDKYRAWVTDKIASRMSSEGLFPTPDQELSIFFNVFESMYDSLTSDNKPFSKMDLCSFKKLIIDKCYIFHAFQGRVEEVTSDHIDFDRFPKALKDRLLSGEKSTMVSVYTNKQDQFVLDCLGVFIQLRMTLLCLGATCTYDELYSKSKEPFLRSYMLAAFIGRSLRMPPCCLGCYINLYQFITHLDRNLLIYRLKEYIVSPEIHNLLVHFINNSIVYLDKKKPGLQETLISQPKGIVQAGAIASILFDFYLDEFDFYMMQLGFYYNRLDHDIFIGIPIKEMVNSSVDVIKNSVVSNITEALHKMRIDNVEKYLSPHFIVEGVSIPLYGGELKLISNQFQFHTNKRDGH